MLIQSAFVQLSIAPTGSAETSHHYMQRADLMHPLLADTLLQADMRHMHALPADDRQCVQQQAFIDDV